VAREIPSPSSVRKSMESSLSLLPSGRPNRERQIAFYGGSFTEMGREDQIAYLRAVQPFLSQGMIQSIRISTRPDALSEATLPLLKEYGVKTIEVGAQSMIDKILLLSHRGHTAEDTVSAILRLRQWGFEVGVHLMVGLLGETRDHFLRSLDQVIELKPDFVRIHPTLVLRGAPLEQLWRIGEYIPLSLEETVDWLKPGILRLEKAFLPAARIGLQPSKDLEEYLMAGPYHPALRQLIDSAIFFDMAQRILRDPADSSQAIFLCHPKEVSNLRGQRNGNIFKLKERFKLSEIFVEERQELPRGYLVLRTPKGEVSIDRKSLDS